MKHVVEDQELRSKIVEYLGLTGVEVSDDTPVSITLPGAGSTPQRCASGSGLMTAGGRFAPGYDAKLKSSLYAIVRGTPEKISPELVENGPMYIPVDQWTPEKAIEVLNANGWPLPTIKVPKPKKEKAAGSEDGGDPPTRKGRKAKQEAESATEDEAEKVEETV